MSRKGKRAARKEPLQIMPVRGNAEVAIISQALSAKYSHLPTMSDTIDDIAMAVFDLLPETSMLEMDELLGIVCRVWNEARGVTDRHPDLFEIPDDLLYRAEVMRAIEIAKTLLPAHGADDPRIIERFFYIPHPDGERAMIRVAWSEPKATPESP